MNHDKQRKMRMIAQETAKILVEEAVDDQQFAKQKAAKRLGYNPSKGLPGADEVEAALDEYHRLFRANIQHEHIRKLRTIALEAMNFLRQFKPRLTGSVVDGNAGRYTPVVLYLSSDSPESVFIALFDADIPFQEFSQQRLFAGRKIDYPMIELAVDGHRIHIHILPETTFREHFQNRKTSGRFATIQSLEELLGKESFS